MSFFIVPLVLRWFGFGSFLFLTLYEMDQQLFRNASASTAYQPDLKCKYLAFSIYTITYLSNTIIILHISFGIARFSGDGSVGTGRDGGRFDKD